MVWPRTYRAADAVPASPLLDARALTVALGGRPVVRDLTAGVRPGEWVALVGANGVGKTTALRALAGLIPHTGTVHLDGRPVGDWTPRERARRLAFVRQGGLEGAAFTVRETVEMGRAPHLAWTATLRRDDHAAVAAALAAFDLVALADRPLALLSGGERQRVALAQALAQGTPVVLLDEPTAHLDVRHALDLLDRSRALADAGRAVLAAVHDLALAARFADRILVLQDGRLVADGPPGTVLTVDRLRDAFGVEADVTPTPDGLAIRYLGVAGRSARPVPPTPAPHAP